MGQPVPQHLIRPELRIDCMHVYQSFWELHTCRSFTMGGYGPIPWLRVYEYAKIRGYDEDEIDDFCYLICEMDRALISHEAKKANNG